MSKELEYPEEEEILLREALVNVTPPLVKLVDYTYDHSKVKNFIKNTPNRVVLGLRKYKNTKVPDVHFVSFFEEGNLKFTAYVNGIPRPRFCTLNQMSKYVEFFLYETVDPDVYLKELRRLRKEHDEDCFSRC